MRNPPDPDALRICAIRQKWYAHCIKKFDLIQLTDILEWCVSYPGPVVNDEARRAQAKRDLLQAMFAGEFGTLGKHAVFLIPGVPHAFNPGRYPLRVWPGQMQFMPTLLADAWAPRGLCRRWLEAHGIPVPWWLPEAVAPAAKPASRPAAPDASAPDEGAGAKRGYPGWFDAAMRTWADSLSRPPTKPECEARARDEGHPPTWGRLWHHANVSRQQGKRAGKGGERAA